MTDLIVVKQLPIIEEQLKKISEEIDNEVKRAMSLVVSDETIKDVKKTRAELNNKFKELEAQRKIVKEKVLAPYNQFEEVYKNYVTGKFKPADNILKTRIEEIENEQKKQKENNIRDYFEEYKEFKNIEFIAFEQVGLNITLSASEKSLKEQAKNFVDKVESDFNLINSQEHKDEILVEYKKSLNVSNSITIVVNRYKELEELKKKQEEIKGQQETEKQNIEKVEQVLSVPRQVETKEESKDEILELTFKVRATRNKLKELKNFLEIGEYDYE